MATKPTRSSRYLLVLLVWFAAAVAAGASGQLARLPFPGPQLILGGLTVFLLVAGAVGPDFRRWLAGVNLRQMIVLHLTRFVGIYFLVLYARGELPFAFAVPGGWGDIVVATGALILVLLVPDLPARRGWVQLWNVIGLLDILFVVATAARLTLADPNSMTPLLRMPLSLLITFLVPLIIATHLWLGRRLLTESLAPKR